MVIEEILEEGRAGFVYPPRLGVDPMVREPRSVGVLEAQPELDDGVWTLKFREGQALLLLEPDIGRLGGVASTTAPCPLTRRMGCRERDAERASGRLAVGATHEVGREAQVGATAQIVVVAGLVVPHAGLRRRDAAAASPALFDR